MPWVHRKWVPEAQAPFHQFSPSVLLCVKQVGTSEEPRYLSFSLASFFFGSFSYSWFRKLSWPLESFIYSIRALTVLERNLPWTCLFTTVNAKCMLGNTVDSSTFAMGTGGGHSFLNSAHSLDVILANYWKMVVPAESKESFESFNFKEKP